ncbi:MAG: TonB-dependent receptor, partial [Peptococcaceae bacterium]|nr:TonB-dependent receptor [Peptococcaceae bacterium]
AQLKTVVAKGFRFPTIREMYMFPPQNADLKPEKLWSYELSFEQRVRNVIILSVSLQISFFCFLPCCYLIRICLSTCFRNVSEMLTRKKISVFFLF